MHDLYENLEQLCTVVSEEIDEANEKIHQSGGRMSSGDLELIDKLTHVLKSIKTVKAMMEAEDGYSWDDMRHMDGTHSYRRGQKRDSMGRYSSRPYYRRSYDGDMVAELHELMEEAPNSQMKQKFQQFINEIERMK